MCVCIHIYKKILKIKRKKTELGPCVPVYPTNLQVGLFSKLALVITESLSPLGARWVLYMMMLGQYMAKHAIHLNAYTRPSSRSPFSCFTDYRVLKLPKVHTNSQQ